MIDVLKNQVKVPRLVVAPEFRLKLSRRLVAGAAFSLLAAAGLHAESSYLNPYAFTTVAGSAGHLGTADGTGDAARLFGPYGVAVDGAGNVFVADAMNHTIRKIAPGGVVTTLAGQAGRTGSADGTGSAAKFGFPHGLAVDGAGNLYVADYLNCTIRKITGAGVVTTLAGATGNPGAADGTGSAARFRSPCGVAVDPAGNVYVADSGNATIRRITPGGAVTTLAGAAGSRSGAVDGTGAKARFGVPVGIAVDPAGNLVVAEETVIRKVTPAGVVTTLAGLAGSGGSGDGPAGAARFAVLNGIAVDRAGNVIVADTGNLSIRQIASDGTVTTLAGESGKLGSTDGIGSTARFYHPQGLAVDGAGRVYVADTGSHTVRLGVLAQPALTSPSQAVGIVHRTFHFAPQFSGLPGSFTASGLPPGLGIDPATGVISGTPTATGTSRVKVEATSRTGRGDATLEFAIVPPAVPGDFSGDGKSDVLLTDTATGARAIWIMNGAGIGATTSLGNTSTDWAFSSTGDYNGDGTIDIVLTNTATGERAVWLMNGARINAGVILGVIAPGWTIIGSGDFNGDGKSDVVLVNAATGARAVWLMNGAAIGAVVKLPSVAANWSLSGVGDFNGDGKPDFVLTNPATGERAIWLMNGTTIGAGGFLPVLPTEWAINGSGDFDGDGKSDILLTNTVTGERVVWLMNGLNISVGASPGVAPPSCVVSLIGDFNGDGKSDILLTNPVTGERTLWLMNGTAVTTGVSLGLIPTNWLIRN